MMSFVWDAGNGCYRKPEPTPVHDQDEVHVKRTRHWFDGISWQVSAYDYQDKLVYTRFFDNEPAALRFIDRVLSRPVAK
jgi:hypothetical protein